MRAKPAIVALAALSCTLVAQKPSLFHYDPATEVAARIATGPRAYDPSLRAAADGTLLVAWLDFEPGRGDRIRFGKWRDAGWVFEKALELPPGRYAKPTLTRDNDGNLWLSYEAERDGQWDVFASVRTQDAFGEPIRVSTGTGNDIRHAVAASADGLWIAWQSDRGGQWDVVARRVAAGGVGTLHVVSPSPRGDWHPDVAASERGVIVVWDSYDGGSYDVLMRTGSEKGFGKIRRVAATRAFEGRPKVRAIHGGMVGWIAWEKGAEGWGQPFRGKKGEWNNITDGAGPLHRYREIELVQWLPDLDPVGLPVPMPMFDAARGRPDKRHGADRLGVFYERPELVVDRKDRPWLVYRHYGELQCGTTASVRHHAEQGWKIYARALTMEGLAWTWSQPYCFDVAQRDGLQRLSVAPTADGVAVAFATGRTDRRKDSGPHGIVIGRVRWEENVRRQPVEPIESGLQRGAPVVRAPAARSAPVSLGGAAYQVVYGDLHRHTDLSLCFSFFDGSIEDAYRYAIDVAELDFLAITDHTRDIDHGDVLSQLWWRCTKEVTRHRLGDRFFPYFAFERSHRDTDHNVISLRDDMLRNFPPPLPRFWAEIDADTITIPHNPFIGKLWHHHDDTKRPLAEVYQGCRDEPIHEHTHVGLDRGYHFGFIASSDHLSTRASYACVWTPERDREAIFRSLQARRTFAATAKMRLVFRSGERWMGERFEVPEPPELAWRVTGTAKVAWLDMWLDGAKQQRFEGRQAAEGTFTPVALGPGEHYAYVHAMQVDGSEAWSSPLWFTRSTGSRH